MIMRLRHIRTIRTLGLALLVVITFSISVFPSVTSEDSNEETEILTGSDWFTWTMNGTHHSVLAIANESLNWTSSTVTIFHENGTYMPYDWYNAIEFDSDLEMNHTWYDNGTYFANITLYNEATILANHNWSFYVGSTVDSDKDGIIDNEDSCPDEDSRGYDADADGCIDDSDNDGVNDNVDICPFDSTDGCPAALQDVPTNITEEVPGCIHQSAENYNPDATEDDGSCKYEEDTPGFGILAAIISCTIIALARNKSV